MDRLPDTESNHSLGRITLTAVKGDSQQTLSVKWWFNKLMIHLIKQRAEYQAEGLNVVPSWTMSLQHYYKTKDEETVSSIQR